MPKLIRERGRSTNALFPRELDEIEDDLFQQQQAAARLCMKRSRTHEVHGEECDREFFGDMALNAGEGVGMTIVENPSHRIEDASWFAGT
ncbi:MAG: hypothetical protein WDZ70_00075 [Candidatus Paceibacterota bacterium]